MMRITISLAVCAAIALFVDAHAEAKSEVSKDNDTVVVYPAPEGAALSSQYVVKVNGKPVDVYIAPVWDPSVDVIKYGDVKPYGGPYSFAYFDFNGSVEVEVHSVKPLDHVRVLPESRGIKPRMEGDTMTFGLKAPCQLSIEPDVKNGPLLLFANPLEKNAPKEGDPGVVHFGPGMHKPGAIKLGDNQTLYIAGGAVVKGGILAQGANIRIAGRGILDGLDWEKPLKPGPTESIVNLKLCTNVAVEGIIVKDSWGWTFVMTGCRNVQVDNVKICSTRRPSNDGIDIVNSQEIKIANCFVRSDDDCIAPKGFGWPERNPMRDGLPVEDVTVSHCTLWTDRAHIWRLGGECWAEKMNKMVFRDIDVLHWDGPWLISVEPAEDMFMEDVLFEDIRVNGEDQERFIIVYPGRNQWVRRKNAPGNVRNVTFKNVIVAGAHPSPASIRVAGCDAEHTVEGVTFDNVVRYGQRVTENSPNVKVQEYTKDISFK